MCDLVVQFWPLASAFTILGVFGCVRFVASVLVLLLDEDRNPGCWDCGRPLWLLPFVLLKMVNGLQFVHWRLDYKIEQRLEQEKKFSSNIRPPWVSTAKSSNRER